jgi:hypothetical protein
MSEPHRPSPCQVKPCAGPSPLTGWRARLIEEAEKVVKNRNRPFIIVLRWDGSGAWQVIPTTAPTARIDTDGN